MTQYVFGDGVELDLDAIWEFIANDDPIAADRWIDKLFQAFETLATNPRIGHRRDDLTRFQLLFWPVGAYLVIYRVQADSVEIVAVTQGSRDVPTLLAQRFS